MIRIINPREGGTARTIKSQYWKCSLANFVRNDGLGATGVIEIYENNGDRLCVPEQAERHGALAAGDCPVPGGGLPLRRRAEDKDSV